MNIANILYILNSEKYAVRSLSAHFILSKLNTIIMNSLECSIFYLIFSFICQNRRNVGLHCFCFLCFWIYCLLGSIGIFSRSNIFTPLLPHWIESNRISTQIQQHNKECKYWGELESGATSNHVNYFIDTTHKNSIFCVVSSENRPLRDNCLYIVCKRSESEQ